MKTDEQMAFDVLEKASFIKAKQNRQKKIIASALCLVVVAGSAFGISKNLNKPTTPEVSVSSVTETQIVETTEQTQTEPSSTEVSSTEETTEQTTVSALGVKRTGTPLTDNVAMSYFEEQGNSMFSDLSINGIDVSNYKISESGYSPLNTDTMELKTNQRKYDVSDADGNIVAIITLTLNEDGTIDFSTDSGESWFDDYTAFLENHQDEELVFTCNKSGQQVYAEDDVFYCHDKNEGNGHHNENHNNEQHNEEHSKYKCSENTYSYHE